MTATLVIPRRYRGPGDSANGGYAAGLLARHLPGTAEITLHRPPPLDRPLLVRQAPGGGVELLDAGSRIAAGRAAALEFAPPPAPPWPLAAASRHAFGLEAAPAAVCFVCGEARAPGDGLRLLAGPVDASGRVATTWVPPVEFDDGTGHVRPELVWAVLDCPGGYALVHARRRTIVTGRLTVRIEARPRVGEGCIVAGWPGPESGRKLAAGTALYRADGEPLAVGAAIWFDMGAAGA